jgi:hypothetical protein
MFRCSGTGSPASLTKNNLLSDKSPKDVNSIIYFELQKKSEGLTVKLFVENLSGIGDNKKGINLRTSRDYSKFMPCKSTSLKIQRRSIIRKAEYTSFEEFFNKIILISSSMNASLAGTNRVFILIVIWCLACATISSKGEHILRI